VTASRRDPHAPRRRGAAAERLAEAHLVAAGWFPLARNHSCREGEVDLVVARAGTVAFVEVRERRRGAAVDPLRSVTRAKQRRIVRAAMDWVARTSRDGQGRTEGLRFDVVAVTPAGRGRPPEVLHVEGAFDASAADRGD